MDCGRFHLFLFVFKSGSNNESWVQQSFMCLELVRKVVKIHKQTGMWQRHQLEYVTSALCDILDNQTAVG